MLENVLDVMAGTLSENGIDAFLQFPERFAGLKSGVFVCVSTESCRCLSSGMGEYLGVREGAGGEPDRELYGMRLELTLGFEVFSSFGEKFGAAACLKCVDELKGIFSKLPAGIRVSELNCGPVSADENLAVFRSMCRLNCMAFLVAESGGDESEFLDYALRGTVKF